MYQQSIAAESMKAIFQQHLYHSLQPKILVVTISKNLKVSLVWQSSSAQDSYWLLQFQIIILLALQFEGITARQSSFMLLHCITGFKVDLLSSCMLWKFYLPSNLPLCSQFAILTFFIPYGIAKDANINHQVTQQLNMLS